ncbi:MAG: PEP-CTERM sorting domain-containing protein [Acidobacteriaceae bacterium]|nr:PEP-CTERM sorting domain-containing protein [Acidobacteriaceae bacterium]
MAAVACLAPVVGHAAPVTMNPTLKVDGLTFGNFGCVIEPKNDPATSPSKCSSINVDTKTPPGTTGIHFSDGFFASGTSYKDVTLTYQVLSNSPISSIGLGFDGTFFGEGISSVTEKVMSGSTTVGFAQVVCGSLPGAGTNCGDHKEVSIPLDGSYYSLYVEKDIYLNGLSGSAVTSNIDQTFTDAPEPGSTALLGSGLLAVAGLLRRRSILGMLKK